MQLIGLKLQNFRAYKEEIYLSINDLTAIIGINDVGKSSLFDGLNIFFNDTPIDSGDANSKGDKTNVCITAIFSNFKDIIIDSDFPTTLKDEYLLNQYGNLEIIKKYDCQNEKVKQTGVYLKADYPSVEGMNDLHKLKNDQLKKKLKELGLNGEDINLTINSQIRQKIWKSVPDLKLELQEILISDKAYKDIWEELKKQLPIFALFKSDRAITDQDDEAQDPMKAAVKEVLNNESEKFRAIQDLITKEVMKVANATVEKIKEMDPSLANELNPKVNIKSAEGIFKLSLTGEDDISINKRGSGIRRLILLNFFRAQAERRYQENKSSSIIYAIEEPETFQNVTNQRILMRSFMELSEAPGCQILLTTHTPIIDGFVPLVSLRYLEKSEDGRRIIHNECDDQILELIIKSLGVLPENRIKLFIAVEGINDINFILNISKILHDSNNFYPNLEMMQVKKELIFLPLGGSNLIHWINRLEALNRPEYHIYDRDTGEKTKNNLKKVNEINQCKNCKAILTKKREMENYIHPTAIKEVFDIDISNTLSEDDDVPLLVAKLIYEKANTSKIWDELSEEKKKKKISSAKSRLNTDCIKKMNISLLNEIDPEEEVRGWLSEIRNLIEINNFDKSQN